MKRKLSVLCKAYCLAALLAMGIIAPPPGSFICLGLLVAALINTRRPFSPDTKVVLAISGLFIVPVSADMWLMNPYLAAVAAVPFLLPVVSSMKDCSRQIRLPAMSKGQHLTGLSITMFGLIPTGLLAALFTGRVVLLFITALYLAFLIFLCMRSLRITLFPLKTRGVSRSVIAGNTTNVQIELEPNTRLPLRLGVNAVDQWMVSDQTEAAINRDALKVNLTITPPLSGPAKPLILVSCLDPWGLIIHAQSLEPVTLNVIPRARYAAWMAARFLENAGEGSFNPPGQPVKDAAFKKGTGIEYYADRAYTAGDSLRSINWKHTLKLRQLVVKDFLDAAHGPIILVASLTAADAEEADKLAYNLISAALTLAENGLPSGLAFYNANEVLSSIAPQDPAATLKITVELMSKISLESQQQRYLQPTDVTRLRSNISYLKQTDSESSKRLSALLKFEYTAFREKAAKHPANAAISAAVSKVSGPALLAVLSRPGSDADALNYIKDHLSRRHITCLVVNENRPASA